MKQAGIGTCVLPLLVLSLCVPPAVAEDEVEGEIVFGPQYYADTNNRDSAKFEEFRDVPNGFVAEHFLFLWRPGERSFFSVDATDISQRDQRLQVDFGKQDLWHGNVRWAENPRQWTDQAFQLFAQTGPAVFTLEDSFQAAVRAALTSVDADGDLEWDPGTKGFVIKNAIAAGAQEVEVGHERKKGGFGLEFTPSRNWTFAVEADRERRTGTTPQTLGMYFALAPAEVAAPLDYKTDTATASSEYSARNFNLGARLTSSQFTTGYNALRWDDQLFLVDEAVVGNPNAANPGRMQMSLGVDNDSTQASLFGGANLPGKTRIDVSIARGETTQNDDFLPMTINSLLVAAPLPAGSYDGKHETLAARLQVSSRPSQWFRWSAWWRRYELDNKSPELTFDDYVSTDYQFILCTNLNSCDANGDGILNDRIARRSLPYAYQRDATGALVGWSPAKWFEGSISFERESLDREFSAVESSDEDIWKLVLDFDAADWLSIRTNFRRQERRADHYDVHYFEESFPIGEAFIAPLNEGSRRFTWTDRDRDAWGLIVDITPHEKLSFYAEANYADDHYTDPETGLDIGQSFTIMEDRNFDSVPETINLLLAGRTKDRATTYSVGFTITPNPRLGIFGDYTWDTWEYALETRYRAPISGIGSDDPLDNWGSDIEDKYRTASFGVNWALTEDKRWSFNVDGSYSEGTGDIRTHFVPGGQASSDTTLTHFPLLVTTLKLAVVSLTHRIRPNLDYSLKYWYEDWEEHNFAADFSQPYMGDPGNDPGSAQSIFLGLDFDDYSNHILSFLMRYTF